MRPANQFHVYTAVILTALLVANCRDTGTGTHPNDVGPRIQSVHPLQGKFGTSVQVTVTGFPDAIPVDDISLTFNGDPAELVSSTANTLAAIVPKGSGSGPVNLYFDGDSATGPTFTYLPTVHVSTYAGTGTVGYRDGEASQAQFNYPVGLELMENGDLVVVDYWNHSIRIVSTEGQVRTLAGSPESGYRDGFGTDARFFRPIDVEVAGDGSVYVSDFENHVIRHITPSGSVSTFAGSSRGYTDGPPTLAQFSFPAGLGLAEDQTLYVSDSGNNRVRKISPNGETGTFAGSGSRGFENGYGLQARFRYPFGFDFGTEGRMFLTDYDNHSIRLISSEGFVSTLSGNGEPGYMEGDADDAQYNMPYDVAVDNNDMIYVADYGNNRIRRIPLRGPVTDIAGDGVPGFADGDETEARFNGPIGLAINEEGTVLYIADHKNHAIRKVTVE